jgi:hypothetical protein
MTLYKGISRHVGNVISTMTKRDQIKDLYLEVEEEMENIKPDCFSYLRRPQMYAENECDSRSWLEQCDKASGDRWNG